MEEIKPGCKCTDASLCARVRGEADWHQWKLVAKLLLRSYFAVTYKPAPFIARDKHPVFAYMPVYQDATNRL